MIISRDVVLHVVHDRAGRILAAAMVEGGSNIRELPTPIPIAIKGQRSARFSIGNDLDASEMAAFLAGHRVHGKAERATLVRVSKRRNSAIAARKRTSKK